MENAPGEGGRRVQNEGPKGSWELLGAMWAQGGRRERLKSLLAAARGRPGGPQNFMWRLLGASWGGKLIDLGGPGAPRSLPESLPESIFEASFLGAPPGTNKV